ncbi:MAG: Nif11-like leader peptide family natural product precursor [Desulfohalobiaceae bacterium]
MSIEQAQAFMEKVKNDEGLAKRLSEAQDSESKLEIARQEGYEFDLEEAKKAKDQLGEDELDDVACGAQSSGCTSSVHNPT